MARPRRRSAALLSACLAGSLSSRAWPGDVGLPIEGSKHDFAQAWSGDRPAGRCAPCHLPRRPKQDPPSGDAGTAAPWLDFDGAAGDTDELSVPELLGSRSALCLSCHDGHAGGRTQAGLAREHPVGVVVPFTRRGWMNDVLAGNRVARSDVVLDTRSSVGCLSCHAVHGGLAHDPKLRRRGEFCYACHDR